MLPFARRYSQVYSAQHTLIREQKYSALFAYLDLNSRLAKNLYNASLYRVRQIFTGWDKDSRTANEQEVFDEVRKTEEMYNIGIRRVISYYHLEKLMRATHNPDFFSGLPMHTAQHVLKLAVQNFKAWLEALKAYRRDESAFLGKPRMPGYLKNERTTFVVSNQEAVVYREKGHIKLPHTKEKLSASNVRESWRLKQITVKPMHGAFDVVSVFEMPDTEGRIADGTYTESAAIDFGVKNIAAIVYTDGRSRIYKGGALLSELQLYAKRRAKAVQAMTHGHKNRKASSKRLTRMDLDHENYVRDALHQISRSIVNNCLEHKAGTLVLGVNKLWKQESGIGRQSNQQFVLMPIARLRSMITYKAERAGIKVIVQEESYTSRASFPDGDDIPEYGKAVEPTFSGKRVRRGLYRTADGLILNADCNAAANILKKALPAETGKIKDFQGLVSPEVIRPKRSPVKGIAAA